MSFLPTPRLRRGVLEQRHNNMLTVSGERQKGQTT